MSNTTKLNDNQKILRVLKKIGVCDASKITDTLQGSIWSARSLLLDKENDKIYKTSIFKITNKHQHEKRIAIVDNKVYTVNENILMEQSILKYLTQNPQCPPSIVKFMRFFRTGSAFYLEMEHGGSSLFDFIQKAHNLINKGNIEISEWHRTVKVIFKQMIESVEYVHSKDVCHFDISLENYLINDPDVYLKNNVYVHFATDNIQAKLCDFGLAQKFTKSECQSSKYCGKTSYKSPEVIAKKKKFNPKMNDIWCLGVCLFVMIFGGFPWDVARKSDESYNLIINGYLIQILESWGKLQGVTADLILLFNGIFQAEEKRFTLSKIKNSKWLK